MNDEITFEVHPCIRVVGELLPQGHELPWRRKAVLYMVPPKEWPVPEGFRERLEDGRVRLNGEFRVRRGKIIGEDRDKAMRQVNWYFIRVQVMFWKDLFAKGIIFGLVSRNLKPEIRTTPPMVIPKLEMRLLVPKGMLDCVPESEPENNPVFLNLYEHTTLYFPGEPEAPDSYDEYFLGEIYEDDYIERGHLPRGTNTPFLLCFDTVRAAILEILNPSQFK